MNATPAPPRRRLPVWLIGSIILNGLLAGLVLGMAAAGPRGGAGGPPPQARAPEELLAQGIIRAAPPRERRAIRRDLRDAWVGTRSERDALAEARRELVLAMVSDPENQSVVDAAFEQVEAADRALKKKIQVALSRGLAKLPEARRQMLIDAIESGDRRGRRRFPRRAE